MRGFVIRQYDVAGTAWYLNEFNIGVVNISDARIFVNKKRAMRKAMKFWGEVISVKIVMVREVE